MTYVLALASATVLYLVMRAVTRPHVTLAVSGPRLRELSSVHRGSELERRRNAQARAARQVNYAPELSAEAKKNVVLHLALVKGDPGLDEGEAERLRSELLERRLIAADQLREAA